MENKNNAGAVLAPVTSDEKLKVAVTTADVEKRFADVLGGTDNAKQFLANVVSTVANNTLLRTCSTNEILSCAFTAAALNLDVIPGLGFAAIVPYKKSYKDENGKWQSRTIPQFQIMTRGFIQLALRSEQIININVTDVYEDELALYDRLTGEIKMHFVSGGQRDRGEDQKVIGYACYVKLRNGFEKTVYWTIGDIRKHAERYSQAYQYDIKEGKQTSPWSTNFKAMAEKTVIKATISKWVPMSTQMRFATMADQSTKQDVTVGPNGELDGKFSYDDNDITDAQAQVEETPKKTKAELFREKHSIGTPKTPAPTPESFDDDDIPWPEGDDGQKEMF